MEQTNERQTSVLTFFVGLGVVSYIVTLVVEGAEHGLFYALLSAVFNVIAPYAIVFFFSYMYRRLRGRPDSRAAHINALVGAGVWVAIWNFGMWHALN